MGAILLFIPATWQASLEDDRECMAKQRKSTKMVKIISLMFDRSANLELVPYRHHPVVIPGTRRQVVKSPGSVWQSKEKVQNGQNHIIDV